MTTFTEAKTPRTVAAVRATFLAALSAAGAPVAGWSDNAPQRILADDFATRMAEESAIRADMARLVDVNELALDATDASWSDAFALFFDEARIAALPAVYDAHLTTISSPTTIEIGALLAQSTATGTPIFVNAARVVLNPSGDVRIQCRTAGTVGNVTPPSISKILSGPSGITGTAPATPVTQGRDAETNGALMRRCLNKWARLGAGWTEEAIAYLIQVAAPTVTRWRIYTDNPRGPGTTLVIAAGPTNTSTGPEVAAILALLSSRSIKPCGSGPVYVEAAIEQPVALTATLDDAGGNATLTDDAETAVLALLRAFPIGIATVDDSILRAVLLGGDFTSIPVVTGSTTTTIAPVLAGFTGASGVASLSYGAPLTVGVDSVLVPTAVVS